MAHGSKEVNENYKYAIESMRWYGWGSPVGLSVALVGVGIFLWMLHLANIIK